MAGAGGIGINGLAVGAGGGGTAGFVSDSVRFCPGGRLFLLALFPVLFLDYGEDVVGDGDSGGVGGNLVAAKALFAFEDEFAGGEADVWRGSLVVEDFVEIADCLAGEIGEVGGDVVVGFGAGEFEGVAEGRDFEPLIESGVGDAEGAPDRWVGKAAGGERDGAVLFGGEVRVISELHASC